MTPNAFMRTVRTYRDLSQRKHRSYAEAVAALLTLRLNALDMAEMPAEQREQGKSDAVDFVAREYGAVDAAWQYPPTP